MCMHVHYYVLTSIVLQMGCKKGKSWSSTFGLHFASLGHKEFKIGLQSFLHLLLIVSIHCLYWLQWDWMLNSEPETQFKLCWQILSHYVVRNWPAKNPRLELYLKVDKNLKRISFSWYGQKRKYKLSFKLLHRMINVSFLSERQKKTEITPWILVSFDWARD